MKCRCAAIVWLSVAATTIWGAEPASPELILNLEGSPQMIRFNFPGTQPFLIQVSTNGSVWTPYINVFSHLQSVWVLDRSLTSATPTMSLFKVAGTTQSPTALSASWSALSMSHYRFRESRLCSCSPFIAEATVIVQDGKVVSIQDATSGGQPIQSPPISQFKSIEELFDLLITKSQTADILSVRFDEVIPVPLWIYIDPFYNFVDDETGYSVRDIVRLE
jgi:hypothetical protein